ncbi:MAG: DUF4279 domain-containing protein [Planctomycetales bacterium]|nr:DUF4279 domain-containing protein [Planctomycetales bacterium]
MSKRIYTSAYASARFGSEDLDPLMITQALLLPPAVQHRAGEPRLSRSESGRITKRPPHRLGLWSMSSEQWVNSPRLHVHLIWLLDELEPHQAEVHELLINGCQGDLFEFSCGSTPVRRRYHDTFASARTRWD